MSAVHGVSSGIPGDEAELWACTLDLLWRSGSRPSGDYQRQVHAAFLRWLQAVDPSLTDELHRPNALRPFTIAVLGEKGHHPSLRMTLRCTVLDRRVFQAFVQRCLPGGGSTIWRLHGAAFELTHVSLLPDSSGWTGWANFAGLLRQASAVPGIAIEFVTPTAFSMGDEVQGAATNDVMSVPAVLGEHSGDGGASETAGIISPIVAVVAERAVSPVADCEGNETITSSATARECTPVAAPPRWDGRKRIELFPQPRWVWESWMRKWNAFASPAQCIDMRAVAAAAARGLVADYELRTVTLDYGRFPQKGFVGWVRYDFRAATERELRQLNALADFACYAGTGYKTAQGMGQTRRRP